MTRDRPQETRYGTVALVGKPNTGKSSLLNAIVGTPLSMVSAKAQATRMPVTGLHTTESAQLVFLDLPGLLDPAYALQRSLRLMALQALASADLLLHLHPAPEAPAPELALIIPELAGQSLPASLLVYTKADLIPAAARTELAESGAIVVSTEEPGSIAGLIERASSLLPKGQFRHDPEDIGTQPVRFFVGEYLREAAFNLLEDEVPYAVTAVVEEFREDRSPVYIRATLFVERESQKGIVIGKGGAVLRDIGTHARHRLETLLQQRVYLETRVKVLPNWRRQRGALTRFGFPLPPDETT